jgi:hypothetical protein
MLKRLLLAALFLLSVSAGAREYTDVYYDQAESGWGMFLVQSDTTQFVAFFIYGPDGKPTWYVAILADNGAGSYTGDLLATTGTYFANPWQGYQYTVAGTVTFTPIDIYHATLSYTVNGVGTVTRTVVRQTLAPYVLGGNYSGSASGAIVGCSDPTKNEPSYRARYGLAVTQDGDSSVTLTFNFVDQAHSGLVCTISGPLSHYGRLYQLAGQSSCTVPPAPPGTPDPMTIDGLHPTGQGIEGHVTGTSHNGCQTSIHFSAVLNVNN